MDVEALAREAGIVVHTYMKTPLADFAHLIREAERERCAKVCDKYAEDAEGFTEEENAAQKLAEAIRSGG